MPTPANTENYAIGKGILYIGEWSGNTPPTDPAGYEDMGNCTSIEVEPTIERLPHYSSRAGFRTKDKNPITQTEYMVRFDLDEIAAANLNKFLLGTLSGNNVIQGLQGSNKEFALKFVSDNPLGPNQTWRFWKATLTPNGAMQLIGEEWMVMSFSAEGLADVANQAASPYFTVTYVTTTTTTTTTTT
jgi:hypothetical protein